MEIGKKFDSKLTLLTVIGKDVTTSDMSQVFKMHMIRLKTKQKRI